MKAGRLDWVDALKGISILLVVYYHVVRSSYSIPFELGIYDRTLFDSLNYFIVFKLVPLRMPLFFLISGFLTSKAIINKTWGETFHSKIGIYIYIFLLWAIIQNLVFKAIGNDIPLNTAPNALYANDIGDFFRLVFEGRSTLWYLYALVIYFSVTKLCRNAKWVILTCALLMNTYSIVENPEFPYRNMTFCYIFFVAGVFWGNYIFDKIQRIKNSTHGILIILSLVVLTLAAFGLRYRLFESIIAVYLVTLLVLKLSQMGLKFESIRYVGVNTLPVYIIHPMLVELSSAFIIPWIITFEITNYWNHLLYSLTTPLLLVTLCVVLSLFFWKITNISLGKFLYNYSFR